MGTPEITAFLSHLAMDGQGAASTQNQALSALLFLYRTVLNQDLDGAIDALRAKRSRCESDHAVATALEPGQTAASARSRSGLWLGVSAVWSRTQVWLRRSRLDLTVC
jgi:hypothetical protein